MHVFRFLRYSEKGALSIENMHSYWNMEETDVEYLCKKTLHFRRGLLKKTIIIVQEHFQVGGINVKYPNITITPTIETRPSY